MSDKKAKLVLKIPHHLVYTYLQLGIQLHINLGSVGK